MQNDLTSTGNEITSLTKTPGLAVAVMEIKDGRAILSLTIGHKSHNVSIPADTTISHAASKMDQFVDVLFR